MAPQTPPRSARPGKAVARLGASRAGTPRRPARAGRASGPRVRARLGASPAARLGASRAARLGSIRTVNLGCRDYTRAASWFGICSPRPSRTSCGPGTAWAARLKEEGRTSEAAEVQRLRKPTPAVWSVNQLAPASPGEDPRARRGRRGAETRPLQGGRCAGPGDGTPPGDPAGPSRSLEVDPERRRASALRPMSSRRIANTLSGAVADPGARSELLQGRLTEERDAPGFEALAGDRQASPAAGAEAPRLARQTGTASPDTLRRARADVREQEGRARVLEQAAAQSATGRRRGGRGGRAGASAAHRPRPASGRAAAGRGPGDPGGSTRSSGGRAGGREGAGRPIEGGRRTAPAAGALS